MSYSINISGHKEVANDEDAETFEQEIAAKAAEFAQALDGVTTANFYGGRVNRNLLDTSTAPDGHVEVDDDSDQTEGQDA